MPELPEMETYKILLRKQLAGSTITNTIINREKSINIPADMFIAKLQNLQVTSIVRRAKYLVFQLSNGYGLLLHLMLGGWMFYGKQDEKPNRTVQVQLSFGENHLYFIGLRLGYLHLLAIEQIEQELLDLGPEPLDANFSLDTFLNLTTKRKGALKTTLVNQKYLAGIGNRYSDEILWHAALFPERRMTELNQDEKVRLFQSIRFTLQDAIQSGGYMDEPVFHGDAITGGYRNKMNVHGRQGQACKRCGSTVRLMEIASRKTFYCPNCQQ